MTIRIEQSAELTDAVLDIRRRVFINEQGIPEEVELDGTDGGCLHWLLYDADQPRATLRSKITGTELKIGRVATLPEGRGKGFAGQLMRAALDWGREKGVATVYLSAQQDVIPWYEGFGFVAEGAFYDDGGIPHRDMRLVLGACAQK